MRTRAKMTALDLSMSDALRKRSVIDDIECDVMKKQRALTMEKKQEASQRRHLLLLGGGPQSTTS